MRPVFDLPDGEDAGPDDYPGTVTAGNAPGITDGAAATILASEAAVERHGLRPLARIVGYAQAEVDPKWIFLAPVTGVRRLLGQIKMTIDEFDLIEINEAFAAVVLSWLKVCGADPDNVNVNVGAIALRHPVGATGSRLIITALNELERQDKSTAFITMCCGASVGTGTIIERL